MTRIAIVGGGIAGLAIARALKEGRGEAEGPIEILVLEKNLRPGGNIRTDRDEGYLLEWGPNGFLDNVPEMLGLVRSLGLQDEIQRSDDAARKRFIFRGGTLHPLPDGPGAFLTSRLLSWPGKLRLALEPFARRRPEGDETIHGFASRRIGYEAATILIDSLVSGIFAGDSRRLSLRACFPKMWQMETDHGGLFRAMLALRKAKKRGIGLETGPSGGTGRNESGPGDAAGGDGRGGRDGAAIGAPTGTLTSFREGTETLIQALARDLGSLLKTDARVAALRRLEPPGAPANGATRPDRVSSGGGRAGGPRDAGGRWSLSLDDGSEVEADAVVLAGPAADSARLLDGIDAGAAGLLRGIETAPVVVVALGYDAARLPRPLDGFGFLVPRGEGPRILGCLWDSSIYPGRAPAGKALVRAMIGGAHDPEALALGDDAIMEVVRSDLRRTMDLDLEPELVRIYRHPLGIPQYTPGHLARLEAVDAALAPHPGLHLAGNSYRGVSMNACVAEAGPIAEAVLAGVRDLTAPSGPVLG